MRDRLGRKKTLFTSPKGAYTLQKIFRGSHAQYDFFFGKNRTAQAVCDGTENLPRAECAVRFFYHFLENISLRGKILKVENELTFFRCSTRKNQSRSSLVNKTIKKI